MGWACYPTRNGRSLRRDAATNRIKNKTLAAAFQEAAKEARRQSGSADGLLESGSLHLRECADMLRQATGLDPYSLKGWTAEDVQRANWQFDYWKSRRGEYWSARKFLETCAAHHLGVKFSY